jgi:dipeptidyl aminopeptidase/acylaminoacyl peptidase
MEVEMMKSIMFVSIFLIVCLGESYASESGQRHPFSVHDLLAMDRITEPQVSPDGKQIVFVLRRTDLEANRGRKDLWLVRVDGKGLHRLTSHQEDDYNPCWSHNGEFIYYLSARSGSTQIWRIDPKTKTIKQMTDLPLDVGNLIVSPDGNYLAFTLEVFPDLKSIDETKARLDAVKKRKSSGKIFERLFIRHWDTWEDGRRSHLFVMPVVGGKVVDVMAGMNADTPSIPWGGTEEITFTPDNKGLIFTTINVGGEEAWSTNYNLYFVPIDGSAFPKCLTGDNKAWDTQTVFSPDGKTLAYLAMKRPGYESDRYRIMLKSWPDGETRNLTEKWDRSPSTIFWSGDGETIYAVADHLGQQSLFSINISTGNVKIIIEKGFMRSPSICGDRIVFGLDHLTSPTELYSVKSDGEDRQKITDINAKQTGQVKMGEPEQFTFRGWHNETVYGYIVKPVDFDPKKTYPVAFLIHGGPQGSFGNDFHYRWNPQVYAGAGYAAVMIDFHGSIGYGRAFKDAIRNDWGGKPLVDLQKGLEAALKKYLWMDGSRVGALGASYGGYMINFIEGNWPDRFRCFVNHDGTFDERMSYFDTEELWFPEWEHEGTPWEKPKNYEKHNPVNFVKNWKTPMLVVHGAQDFRVPETQGFATFTALQRLGIPSKLLYFPDENHWVQKPNNSILWHETVIGWLDRWLK